MKKITLIIILVFVIIPKTWGQSVAEEPVPNLELQIEEILDKFQNLPCHDSDKNYHVLPIFLLNVIDYSLEKFNSEFFLSNLEFTYKKEESKEDPRVYYLIYDDSLYNVANSDYPSRSRVHCGGYSSKTELIRLCAELDPEFVFMCVNIVCTYALKDGQIYVFELGRDNKYKTFTLEDYMKNERNLRFMGLYGK